MLYFQVLYADGKVSVLNDISAHDAGAARRDSPQRDGAKSAQIEATAPTPTAKESKEGKESSTFFTCQVQTEKIGSFLIALDLFAFLSALSMLFFPMSGRKCCSAAFCVMHGSFAHAEQGSKRPLPMQAKVMSCLVGIVNVFVSFQMFEYRKKIAQAQTQHSTRFDCQSHTIVFWFCGFA